MKRIFSSVPVALLSLALTLSSCSNRSSTPQKDTTRYSQLVADACLYHFKANTRDAGFARYDAAGHLLAESESTRGFDYVPGLVAKAVVEAIEYYQDSAFVRPWFYSMVDYADRYYALEHDGKSLDDLNACKMYFGLSRLTAPGAVFANDTLYAHFCYAKQQAAKGLTAHHRDYRIADGECAGGWWHKNTYPNQMWCDGQYMGPALLAELLAEGTTLTGYTKDECWQIVMQQFDLTWSKLWVPETGLLRHAFSASPTETTAHTETWADPVTGLSAEYWGRAEGWYFLALVDVLEAMEKDGKKGDTDYQRMLTYLELVAQGLQQKQTANGCWYQLLNHDGDFVVSSYNGADVEPRVNYEEASATAIFAAAYMKAIRLHLLDQAVYGTTAHRAYQGCVAQFLRPEIGDGNSLALVQSCASAGLGGSGDACAAGGKKCRDGSAAYYLQGYDVTCVKDYTEGKILGAFILAAVEYERN